VSPGERVNILVVDDRASNLMSLREVLDRPDYNLMSATSGPEALALVLRHELAVILLDVAMPDMDGFEVAATIKQRERFKTIPIIFVTASVQDIDWIFRAYQIGAVDFLHKPLDPHAVRAKVSVFVELFRQKQQLKRQAAELAELRMRSLAEAIPHIVWTAAPDGQVDYFNRRWSEVTGLDDARSGFFEAVHPDDVDELRARWQSAVEHAQPFQAECRLRQLAGGWRWYLGRAVAERRADEVERWLGTFTDIEEERRAHEESRAAVRMRDEFLSVASHELRTPLSALQLQLQSAERILQSREAPRERLAGKIATSVRQTRRLGNLVDTLLDVSRLASGRLDLARETFDLREAVRDVAERLSEELAQAGCAFNLEAPAAVIGHWDRLRMEQVLTNLIANALKYAPGRPIDVRVDGSAERAQVAVRDHGIGIAAEDRARIFDRFERAVPATHYGGLGLGLYIARQIVEAHGGHIEVWSAPGEGSRFVIDLPRNH
jgi:PAS domain S-box-containing protein